MLRFAGSAQDNHAVRVGKSFVLLALILAALAFVRRVDADDDRTPTRAEFRGTGVIVALLPPPSSLHATRPVIVIHHDPLVPLMPESMEMPFLVASAALFADFRVGDRIAFTLRDTPDALLVVGIERARAAR
jgi:hypothetical protein